MKQLVLLRDQKLKHIARQREKKRQKIQITNIVNKSGMKYECVYTPFDYQKKEKKK